jgi:hypothetical protein
VNAEISINQTAIAPGSAFMNGQTGGQYCTPAQLNNLGALVLTHEQQHVDAYYNTAKTMINADVEPLVKSGASGAQDLLQAVTDKQDAIHIAAGAASAALDSIPSSQVPVPCTVNWSC